MQKAGRGRAGSTDAVAKLLTAVCHDRMCAWMSVSTLCALAVTHAPVPAASRRGNDTSLSDLEIGSISNKCVSRTSAQICD